MGDAFCASSVVPVLVAKLSCSREKVSQAEGFPLANLQWFHLKTTKHRISKGRKQPRVGQQVLWLCRGRVGTPWTLPCLRPSILAQPARHFGEGSLKPLAEKNLVSSPPCPWGGGLVVDSPLLLRLSIPLHARAEQSPPLEPRGPCAGGTGRLPLQRLATASAG